MNKLSMTLIVATSVATLAACSSSSSPSAASTSDAGGGDAAMAMNTSAPSADTQALWTKTSGYKSWPTFTENSTPKLSSSHMGNYVVTYHNDVVTQAIAAKTCRSRRARSSSKRTTCTRPIRCPWP